MPQVTINVTNNSGAVQAFKIFNAPPKSSDTSTRNDPFFNTWGTSPNVNAAREGELNGGVATFKITEQFYAICGDAGSPLAKNLVVLSRNPQPVTLTSTSTPGSDWRVNVPDGGNAVVFDPTTDAADSTVPGGFTINLSNETWVPSHVPNQYCGVARDSPVSTGVVPTLVWPAIPNQTYKVTPTRKYYISYAPDVVGLQQNVQDLGPIATIDFTGQESTEANVTLLADFAFGPVTFSP